MTIQELCLNGASFERLSIAVTQAYPESETLVFVGVGQIKGESTTGPHVIGHYQTQNWGRLQTLEVSSLNVGDCFVGSTGRRWQVLGNASFRGDAHVPSSTFFVAVEVSNE